MPKLTRQARRILARGRSFRPSRFDARYASIKNPQAFAGLLRSGVPVPRAAAISNAGRTASGRRAMAAKAVRTKGPAVLRSEARKAAATRRRRAEAR